jgi:hypothetical protein
MSDELKDILSNSNKDIDNQRLMDYLSSHLSKSDSHEVEKSMAADEFINDAVEGLQQMDSKQRMLAYADQLNQVLHKQLEKKEKRKKKQRWKDSPYTYLTIIILLVLMVISFIILKKHLDNKKEKNIPATSMNILSKELKKINS